MGAALPSGRTRKTCGLPRQLFLVVHDALPGFTVRAFQYRPHAVEEVVECPIEDPLGHHVLLDNDVVALYLVATSSALRLSSVRRPPRPNIRLTSSNNPPSRPGMSGTGWPVAVQIHGTSGRIR